MTEWVPETWVSYFGVLEVCMWEEMGLRQVKLGLSSYFAKFLAFLMIFQIGACRRQHLE